MVGERLTPVTDIAEDFTEDFVALMSGIEPGATLVTTAARMGPVVETICRASRHPPAHDLVVMGSVGRSGLRRMLIGSTAHEVLEQLAGDILIVRG